MRSKRAATRRPTRRGGSRGAGVQVINGYVEVRLGVGGVPELGGMIPFHRDLEEAYSDMMGCTGDEMTLQDICRARLVIGPYRHPVLSQPAGQRVIRKRIELCQAAREPAPKNKSEQQPVTPSKDRRGLRTATKASGAVPSGQRH